MTRRSPGNFIGEVLAGFYDAALRVSQLFAKTIEIAVSVGLLVLLEWYLVSVIGAEGELAQEIHDWTRTGAALIVSIAFVLELTKALFGR